MSIFQKSVLKKYLDNLDALKVAEAYQRFMKHFHDPVVQENIRNSKEEQYQGGFMIDFFVNVLGYIKNPNPDFNITTELKNVKDSKKADGGIIVDDKVIGVIELKGMDTTDLSKVENQAFGYKNNQEGCKYVIISNFEKLRFYIDNAIDHIEFNLFKLSEDEFKLLYLCLSYDSLSKDIPKKIKKESLSQEDVITHQLYKDYSVFKRTLFANLTELNPQYEALLLFKKSQKLLDRFLFLFFAEDRHLLPPNSIRLILSDWEKLKELDAYKPLYDRFKKYFGYLNTGHRGERYDVFAYNGGLFKPDEILDNIIIDDQLLYEHTLRLSEYDFESDVDVNILGHIFENSLNEMEEVQAQLEGQELDKSKTKRKKDGVFYTPKYITKYIVENTVGKLCEEKKEELEIKEEDYISDKRIQQKTKKKLLQKLTDYRDWLLQLTIIDPACGSGAFLNEALNFLIEEHQYLDELEAKVTGSSFVFPNIENSILENNLFGVDLNEESVEIAKLSLWLRTAEPNRKLNDLNNNLKCGNSLIDDPEIAGDKAFDWEKEFPKVFEKGGFDVVIGNPPYVDIKALPKNDVEFYFNNYETTENRINLYSIFIEKGVDILNKQGFLSYINPNSMLMNSSYSKLRKFIFDKIIEIIKLPDDIFSDAKVETIIFILSNGNTQRDVDVIKYNKDDVIQEINESKTTTFNKNNWKNAGGYFNIYLEESLGSILNKIDDDKVEILNDIADFTLGITPYDKYRGHSQELIKNRGFHAKEKISEEYKPLITGENITRYYTKTNINEYIKYGDWLGAKREERFFTAPRILVRQIISGNPLRIYASYCEESFYFTQIGFSIISKNNNTFSNKYILTILNSTLINCYHRYRFLDLEKELFQKFLIANCKKIPIKNISIESQQPFIDKADQMLSLNKDLQEISSKFQRTLQRKFPEELEKLPRKLETWYELDFADFIKELKKKKIKLSLSEEAEWEDYFLAEQQKALVIQSQINATDKEIDQMVYELYGLTEEEIRIVEES